MTNPIGPGYRWNDYSSRDDSNACREPEPKLATDASEPKRPDEDATPEPGGTSEQLTTDAADHARCQSEIVTFYHDAHRDAGIGAAEVGVAVLKGHDPRSAVDAEIMYMGG